MSERSLATIWLLVFHAVLGQQPDPAVKQACTLFKQKVFEERVAISFLIENAPITWETVDSCHGSRPLIVDGDPAESKEFPHAARLGHRNEKNEIKWFCGGTLISNRLVLTAAHCFYTEFGEVNVVRLGELWFDTNEDDAEPEDFGVLRTIQHPDYHDPALYNDIALVRLDRAVNFSLYKHPACLPFDNGDSHDKFIAIGWGQKGFARAESKKLLKVTLRNYGERCVTTTERNEDLPEGYNATTQMCIGSPDSKDTCNGDSGGPVLAYHKDFPCMYHVMGVTSTGVSCNTPDVPGVYTRVNYYLPWIKRELAAKVT